MASTHRAAQRARPRCTLLAAACMSALLIAVSAAVLHLGEAPHADAFAYIHPRGDLDLVIPAGGCDQGRFTVQEIPSSIPEGGMAVLFGVTGEAAEFITLHPETTTLTDKAPRKFTTLHIVVPAGTPAQQYAATITAQPVVLAQQSIMFKHPFNITVTADPPPADDDCTPPDIPEPEPGGAQDPAPAPAQQQQPPEDLSAASITDNPAVSQAPSPEEEREADEAALEALEGDGAGDPAPVAGQEAEPAPEATPPEPAPEAVPPPEPAPEAVPPPEEVPPPEPAPEAVPPPEPAPEAVPPPEPAPEAVPPPEATPPEPAPEAVPPPEPAPEAVPPPEPATELAQLPLAEFVDPAADPSSYVKRYVSEDEYSSWFDTTYPEYDSICDAVGLGPDCVEKYSAEAGQQEAPACGPGTVLQDGKCVAEGAADEGRGGSCLVATAAYGSELAPHVQHLRELRDSSLIQTAAGSSFMSAFNAAYYAFSPAVADLERQSPAFRESVRIFITPMILAVHAVMSAAPGAEGGPASEGSILLYGAASIALVGAMYVAAPALAAAAVHRAAAARRRAA